MTLFLFATAHWTILEISKLFTIHFETFVFENRNQRELTLLTNYGDDIRILNRNIIHIIKNQIYENIIIIIIIIIIHKL